jgi:hypothetical protein
MHSAVSTARLRRIGRMPSPASPTPPQQLCLFERDAPTPWQQPSTDAHTPPPSPTVQPDLLRHPRAQREVTLQGQRVAYEFRVARRRSIGFSASRA